MDYLKRSELAKKLLAEYLNLHYRKCVLEDGEDSRFVENGKLNPHYELGLCRSNLEYLLADNLESLENFETIVEFQREEVTKLGESDVSNKTETVCEEEQETV